MEKRIKISIYISVVLCCLAILVTAIVLSLIGKGNASYPIVDTECGAVEGRLFRVTNDNGNRQVVYEFLNIPYAASPTGPLRWRAPVSLKNRSACWNGTLPYNDEIVECVQTKPGDSRVRGKEDCLVLSVRTTSLTKNKKLPVLVWIHGGGMVWGHSRAKGYYPDTQFTASMGVVTVSINYRLGIFGFLSLKELWEAGEKGGYGNYAIMDQILALRWIKDNIKIFGGNPNDVTIFGQSGGGTATFCLLSASLGMAKGLFHKIIASSGAPNIHTTHEEANKLYRPFIKKTNCLKNTQSCLRALDVKTVVSNNPMNTSKWTALSLDYEWKFPYNIHTKGIPLQILDPLVVKYSPSDLLKHLPDLPHEHRIDILMGNMAQEPIFWVRPNISNWSSWTVLEQYLEPIVKSFNNKCSVTELLELYKNRSGHKFTPPKITPYYIYSLMTADLLLSCATTELAYNLTHYSPFKVYSYIVSQALRPTKNYVFHAEHTFDIIPLFDFGIVVDYGIGYVPTKEDKELKKNLRLIFKNFIDSSVDFEKKHRNRTIEFWNSTTVHTWETPYHERECDFLRKNGFLKHSWGNRGIWNN